jgi:hypothetical protein
MTNEELVDRMRAIDEESDVAMKQRLFQELVAELAQDLAAAKVAMVDSVAAQAGPAAGQEFLRWLREWEKRPPPSRLQRTLKKVRALFHRKSRARG